MAQASRLNVIDSLGSTSLRAIALFSRGVGRSLPAQSPPICPTPTTASVPDIWSSFRRLYRRGLCTKAALPFRHHGAHTTSCARARGADDVDSYLGLQQLLVRRHDSSTINPDGRSTKGLSSMVRCLSSPCYTLASRLTSSPRQLQLQPSHLLVRPVRPLQRIQRQVQLPSGLWRRQLSRTPYASLTPIGVCFGPVLTTMLQCADLLPEAQTAPRGRVSLANATKDGPASTAMFAQVTAPAMP